MTMYENAHAKINLYLHVTGKRDDGYHLLDSLTIFPDIGDRLSVQPLGSDSIQAVCLKITGPFSAVLQKNDHDNNLIVRAAKELKAYTKQILPPVQLCLEKNLPIASGIGGGSADAAATLRLLVRYWHLEIPEYDLLKIALGLGADVPVCLKSQTQRMEGIGEQLSIVPDLPQFGIILVNHGEGVSTAEIFRKRKAEFSKRAVLNDDYVDFESLVSDLSKLNNDLQDPACEVNPHILNVLKEIKELPSCQFVRMSGSGATCFGLFKNSEQAINAASLLSQKYPNWWAWGGMAISSK